MTTNFVFPSDAARAENDELDRVCCYVEELLDQNRELTGTLVKLQRKDAAREQRIQGGFVDLTKIYLTGQQIKQPEDVSFEQVRKRIVDAIEKMNADQVEAVIRQGFYKPPKQFEVSLFDNFTFPIRIPKPFDYARNSFDSPFLFVPETRLNRIKQLQEAFKLATLDPNLFTVERDENGMVI